jgi:hypothetical protein
MESKRTGRPKGSVLIEDSREVKFLVNRGDFEALQQFAKNKERSIPSVMRDLVRAIAA